MKQEEASMAVNEGMRKCVKDGCNEYAVGGKIFCSEHQHEHDMAMLDAHHLQTGGGKNTFGIPGQSQTRKTDQ